MLKPTLGKHRGTYVLVWYDSGKRYRKSLGTADKEQANRFLAAFLSEQELSHKQGMHTVAELCALYVSSKAVAGKPTERINYAFRSLLSEPRISGAHPSSISAHLLNEWSASRRSTASVGTLHVELGYLRACLRWAVRHGYLDKAPLVELPTKPRPKTDYIPRAQFLEILEETKYPHVRLFLTLAISTGGRSSSILELTWDRIDFSKRLINLDNPNRDRTSKGRAIVPMNKTAFAALSEAKKGSVSDYVIEWGGRPIKSMKTAFMLLSKRTGIKLTPHMIRHSAAVWMAEGGVPMAEISQYLGHTNTSVTERVYARFSPGYLQKAASILDL